MSETVQNQVEARGNRKERVGEVISNKMAKTIVVRVERRFPHPQYRKVVTAYTKFYAHDEKLHGELKRRAQNELQTIRSVEEMKRTSGVFWFASASVA